MRCLYGSMRKWEYQQHLFPLRLQMLLVPNTQGWYYCSQVATVRLNLPAPSSFHGTSGRMRILTRDSVSPLATPIF
jgi:hypothetical protein